jgi:hypothetical protein
MSLGYESAKHGLFKQRSMPACDRDLEFTTLLVTVSEHLGLLAPQEDIGQCDSEEVKYRGWWTHPEFKSLGHGALETMPFADLLDRSKDIFNLQQRLQKSPLLQMAVNLGLRKDDVKGFQSLKLVGTICQLAQLAVDSGLDLIQDRASIAAQWDAKVELDPLRPLFKLNGLRVADAHSLSASISQEMIEARKVFGVDHQQYVSGWGGALDRIFDTVIPSLTAVKQLLLDSLASNDGWIQGLLELSGN